MPTTAAGEHEGGAVAVVRGAVARMIGQLGPGLYGVACSGGADSIALADAAIAVAGAPHVVVVTVDHQLAAGSAARAEAVAAWARGQGAAAVVRAVEVAGAGGLEAAARRARYAALDAVADELGLAHVLVGHTARDQAETVLLRVVRGTGPAGLAGIPARRGRIARPLLELPRAAIDAYIVARALPTWHDPMNDDARVARVRARARLLPLLREENPAIDAALCRLAVSAREWLEVLDAAAAPHARFPIDCRALARAPAAVRKRALARALEAAGLGYDAAHLDALDRLVTAPTRGTRAIAVRAARIERRYDTLVPAAPAAPPPALVAPAGPYDLRPWRPGDRMRPARLGGRSRKLSDLFGDAKVPRAARARARVIVRTTDGVIVWAEHLGRAFGEPELLPGPRQTAGSF